jgi:DUF4097 and DUF4098 domain-containing protein YvlB
MVLSRLLCLTLLAASSLPAKIESPRAAFRQSYALAPNGCVAIENLYGDVTIVAWDREEVLVEATKHAADPERLDEARIVVEPSAGRVFIRTQYIGMKALRPASVEYRITVPRTARLDYIKLINGGLSISGVSGPVKASSVNGAIKAEALGGEVELSTVNGPLEAAFNRLNRANPISLTSVNGAIRLSLPAGAGASVNAHNRSGGIESPFGKPSRANDGDRLHAVINRGGAEIQLNNVNGGISIRSTWDRHPRRSSL